MAAEEGTTNSRPPRHPKDRVEEWRIDVLLKLGFMADDAITIAKSRADIHAVADAVSRGCTHEQALAIFT